MRDTHTEKKTKIIFILCVKSTTWIKMRTKQWEKDERKEARTISSTSYNVHLNVSVSGNVTDVFCLRCALLFFALSDSLNRSTEEKSTKKKQNKIRIFPCMLRFLHLNRCNVCKTKSFPFIFFPFDFFLFESRFFISALIQAEWK